MVESLAVELIEKRLSDFVRSTERMMAGSVHVAESDYFRIRSHHKQILVSSFFVGTMEKAHRTICHCMTRKKSWIFCCIETDLMFFISTYILI